MRKPTQEVLAVIASDLHLDHKPPIFRSKEPDWYAAQARPLKQIRDLVEKLQTVLIIPGDIFNSWDQPPELISFAIKNLPRTYAIPGQHDLPFHNYKDRKRSAYQTLVEAGTLIDLEPKKPISTPTSLLLHGFPWEHKITKCPPPMTFGMHIAIIHSYIWTSSTRYEGAPKEQRLREYQKKLKGYDAAFFGDNHNGFLAKGKENKCPILNCGSMMVRNSDQVDYKPAVGILYADGTIERHHLDTSKDVYFQMDKIPEIKERNLELDGFINFMSGLQIRKKAFMESVIAWMRANKISKDVSSMVLEAIEKSKEDKK